MSAPCDSRRDGGYRTRGHTAGLLRCSGYYGGAAELKPKFDGVYHSACLGQPPLAQGRQRNPLLPLLSHLSTLYPKPCAPPASPRTARYPPSSLLPHLIAAFCVQCHLRTVHIRVLCIWRQLRFQTMCCSLRLPRFARVYYLLPPLAYCAVCAIKVNRLFAAHAGSRVARHRPLTLLVHSQVIDAG